MSKLSVFRRQLSPGQRVTLRLTRGEDVSGLITELDETHVSLDIGNRIVTVFEDILAGWEIHQFPCGVAIPPPRMEPTPSKSATQIIDGGASPACPTTKSDSTATESSDPKVLAELSRIEATFAEGILRARLATPEPDFSFSADEFPSSIGTNVRREFDRARNQYDYAIKVREEARLVNIVRQVLLPLVEKHPWSPSIRALTGCLLLRLGQRAESVDHLRTAAIASKKPQHWYALACATTVPSQECFALRNFLLTSFTEDVREAWLRYLLLAMDHADLSGLARLLEGSFSHDRGSVVWVRAAETLVFLLWKAGEHDAAERGASALLLGESFPLEGWRETLRRIFPEPSPELAQEEERQSAPEKSTKKTSAVPTGCISSFGNQRFGFIDAENGETYFFRLEDVADDGLKQALLDGTWRTRAQVEFTSVPSVGTKYQRAVGVLPLQDVTALLDRARHLLKLSQHSQAMALVRRALAAEPDLQEAQLLETNIKEEIRTRGIGLPTGQGPYAQAKRAQLVDQDLTSASRLFRRAIKQGDNRESAVKDLASILLQQGRTDDAVKLLETNRGAPRGVGPYDNMLATIYQQVGRHQEALTLLNSLLEKATRKNRGPILRRIAFSHYKSGSYDEAERTLNLLLNEAPADRTAERWLVGLEEARRSGRYDDAERIIGNFGVLAEEGLELSPLARAAIDSCGFEGVDLNRVQSGSFTDRDVERLEDLAKQLGTRRPRDRAAYYLSAAAILSRRAELVDAARTYDYLRRYFASMGDAAWADQRPADVVRTYYVESLALVSDPELDEAWRTLVRYLATFSSEGHERLEDRLPRAQRRGMKIPTGEYVASLRDILKSFRPTSPEMWRLGCLDASSQSGFFSKAITDAIADDSSLCDSMASLLSLECGADCDVVSSRWRSLVREFGRSRQAHLAKCSTLNRHQLTAASMEDLLTYLKTLEFSFGDLDQRRLADLLEIAQSAVGYCRAKDYEEREQHYWLVRTRVEGVVEQVIKGPTQFSHAALLPLAKHVHSLIEEDYAEATKSSAAQLDLRLLVQDYPGLQQGGLRLQVELANKIGCSPASSVRLIVEPEDSPYFEVTQHVCKVIPALRGGANAVVQPSLRLRAEAFQNRAFPIALRATYRNRSGEDCETEQSEWTVRLYDESEFKEIPNRYAPYAEGGPVDDPEMFVGRAELLEKLEASLTTTPASKCIVVFGQKRAGKSSLLEHLRRRLADRPNCVPIQFSLYEIGPALDEATFFYRILQGIADALEDRPHAFSLYGRLVAPSLESMQQQPTLRFHEAMSGLTRTHRRSCGSDELRLILLIDEFTEIYKQILRGIVPGGFMRAWKAIVEKRYFASVLVGQDIMPAFKSSFPNEFGVTEDLRVTYLPEKEARRLIEEPVGANRYVGNAVDRIIGLTAGSPFYTMMLCNRLVDYMNRTRSAVVTEADIATVEQEMISGDRRLTKDKFDNLICAGDGVEDSGINPEETFRLCAAIAREGERGWCSRESLRAFGWAELDTLLTDLERRDVVERNGEAVRLRVGLFRDWLLSHA